MAKLLLKLEGVDVELFDRVASSVDLYFATLAQFGYKRQTDVNKLLAYIFIVELLTGDMRFLIAEDDYRYIERALHCLYGSTCLIPYPEYVRGNYLFGRILDTGQLSPRIIEDGTLRHIDTGKLRFKASDYNR